MKHPFSEEAGTLFQECVLALAELEVAPRWASPVVDAGARPLAGYDVTAACAALGAGAHWLGYGSGWRDARRWAVVRHAAAHSLCYRTEHDDWYAEALAATYQLWRKFFREQLPVPDLGLAARQLAFLDRLREGKLS